MKPLNPQRQPPVSVVELDKKSSEILGELQEKPKVSTSYYLLQVSKQSSVSSLGFIFALAGD